MQRIGQVLQSSALMTTSAPLQRRLNDAESAELVLLLGQMAQRYPGQDLSDAMEGFLQDLERLALKYSLAKLRAALAELRIKPGQGFFPRPDEVAEEIERQAETNGRRAADRDAQAQRAEWEAGFWKWVEERLAENPGMTEQQVLDSIKTPGYTGRKARK
jgi:hypothetical protein